jgi:hypothetical protein
MKSCVTVQEPTVNASNKIIAKKEGCMKNVIIILQYKYVQIFLHSQTIQLKKPLTSCSVFKRGSQ